VDRQKQQTLKKAN